MGSRAETLGISAADWKRLREIWRGLLKRCENPHCKDYRHYALERHISVCPEWHDFETFAQWALAHGYGPDMTLDRVGNYRGYSPGNCRWISRQAQALNRSSNTRLIIDGKVRTISQWSRLSGTADFTICRRLEAGWTPQDAVFKPSRKKKKGPGAP